MRNFIIYMSQKYVRNGKSEGGRPPGRPGCTHDNNIEIECNETK
jgi:hypothetical protein